MSENFSNLEELLDQIKKAGDENGGVTIDDILDETGRRSFAPMILLAGVIISAPIIGDIPGGPTIMGVFVVLTTAQLLLQRDHFWLPDWILERSTDKEKIKKSIDWLYKPARYIDRILKPRLTLFTHGAGHYTIAAVSFLISLCLPIMEVIPFSANVAGIAFILFGLSLITQDGFIAVLALLFALGTFGIVVFGIL